MTPLHLYSSHHRSSRRTSPPLRRTNQATASSYRSSRMAAPIVTLMLAPALTLALDLTLIRSLQMAGRTSCVQTPKCASLMLLSCTCAHTLAPNPLCNRPPPLASASPTLASTLALAPTPCAPLHSRAPNPRRAAGRAQQLERGLQPHRQAALAAELSSKSTPVQSIVCDYLY